MSEDGVAAKISTMQPRVLFVDDEPHVTDALRRALRKEPYEILTARSADEALHILAQAPVDVIVSDEQMPGMCGSEFLATVRRSYPDTARILLTGHASLEAAVRAINEGEIYRFLTKPCDEGDLTLVIEHALQRKEYMGASQQPLVTAERQSAPLHELEKEYPGITTVQRDANGAIILEDAGVDLETLVQTINAAAAKRG